MKRMGNNLLQGKLTDAFLYKSGFIINRSIFSLILRNRALKNREAGKKNIWFDHEIMTECTNKLPVPLTQIVKARVPGTLHLPTEDAQLSSWVSLKSNPERYCQGVVTLSHAKTESKDGNFLVIGTGMEEIRNNLWPVCNFIKVLF